MAVGSGRGFLTGALLVIFILLTLSAWRFMTSEESLEAFEGVSSTAPTRAADCQCLPGYIPSNKIPKKVLGFENQFIVVKSPMALQYGVNNRWIKKQVSGTFQATNMFFGGDPAPGIRKRVETLEIEGFYFCQSLSNPTETRKCY